MTISTSPTHHQHIRVNLVHLGQEEAEQSPLCRSDLHLPILTERVTPSVSSLKYSTLLLLFKFHVKQQN